MPHALLRAAPALFIQPTFERDAMATTDPQEGARVRPVRAHSTPDPETDPTPPSIPVPDDVPDPAHAPVEEPSIPEPPIREPRGE